MPHRFVLPPIPPEQRTPLVDALLGIIEMQAERIERQDEQIELLKEDIRLLKELNFSTRCCRRMYRRRQIKSARSQMTPWDP